MPSQRAGPAPGYLLVDPQRVVLVGGVARSDLIRALLAERLAQVRPVRQDLGLSSFADDAALLGAETMAGEPAPATA